MPNNKGEGEARIHILNTGGTLGMQKDPQTGAMRSALSAEELLAGLNIPERINATLENTAERKDSTNVTYDDRVKRAESIEKAYDDHDAFIKEFEPDLVTMSVTGDTPPVVLTSFVDSGAIKGVIIACLGAGNIPDIPRSDYQGRQISWIDAIQMAAEIRNIFPRILRVNC